MIDILETLSAEEAAQRLLGTEIKRIYDKHELVGKIVETEAYHEDDPAAHSFSGKTQRNQSMFLSGGHAYVYISYGIHRCMNIVCGKVGEGEGVLIRALEPISGMNKMYELREADNKTALMSGPGKLTQALVITKEFDGHWLEERPLTITLNDPIPTSEIVRTTRVGISKSVEEKLRFYIKDNDLAMSTFKQYLRYLGYLIFTLLVVGMVFLGAFRKVHDDEPYIFGVSFSEKYARELQLETRQAYKSIVQDLGFQKLRLMSYWDLREPEHGNYDFNLLDWMMDFAAQEEKKVSLAVGLRQPRWPECHMPGWAAALSENERDEALLNYIETVVNRYKDHPALESYQLENEAANRHFGQCPPFDEELIHREHSLITRLDPHHPIAINVSNQSGIPLRGVRSEKIGFSMYEHAYFSLTENSKLRKWSYWYLPPSWHGIRAALLELLYTEETFVHELQAEPWGMRATVNLTSNEQLKLMNVEKIKEQVAYAKRTGMREIYLWGGEWWYWRMVEFDDYSFWNTVQSIIQGTNEAAIDSNS